MDLDQGFSKLQLLAAGNFSMFQFLAAMQPGSGFQEVCPGAQMK